MTALLHDRIVVVGARGFIGAALSRALSDKAEVLQLDLPELDITDPESLSRSRASLSAFGRGGRCAVVNAAGLMDAALSRREPDRFYRVNGLAVMDLWALARDAGAGLFVHLSSETVFGSGDQPFEEHSPRVPLHPYGISKLLAELLLASMARSGPPCMALRLPVVVGRGQVVGNPVSMFCEEAVRSGTITIFNGGLHRRTFVHVDDVARAIIAVLSAPAPAAPVFHNIGGTTVSMREVAEAVAARLPGVRIVDKPSANQAFTLTSDARGFEARYGFRPQVDLDGLIGGFLEKSTRSNP